MYDENDRDPGKKYKGSPQTNESFSARVAAISEIGEGEGRQLILSPRGRRERFGPLHVAGTGRRSGERAGRGGPGRGMGRRGGPRNVIGIACAGRRGSGHGTGRGAETGGGTENGSGSESGSGSGSGELHGTGRGPGSGSGFIRIPIPVPIFSSTSGMKFGFGPRGRRERFGPLKKQEEIKNY